MVKPPCKECEGRFVGCHSKCKKYAEYRKKIERINKAKAKQHKREDDFMFVSFGKKNPK